MNLLKAASNVYDIGYFLGYVATILNMPSFLLNSSVSLWALSRVDSCFIVVNANLAVNVPAI